MRLPPRAHCPAPPAALRQSRGWLFRAVGQLYLRTGGWSFEGNWPDDPKCVVIVAPHTSNWDFTLGLAVVFATETRASWLGKHTIFKRPFRGLLRWLGGIPVNRNASHGVVGACVQAFQAVPAMLLGVAPEGTRKGVSQWKTGFYFIACKAGVPILPVTFDYKEHVVRFLPVFHPCGDLEKDLPEIQALFTGSRGRYERDVALEPGGGARRHG